MTMTSWAEIIEELKLVDRQVELLSDTLTLEQLNEFNAITETLYRLISMANQQTGEALTMAENIQADTIAILSAEPIGNA